MAVYTDIDERELKDWLASYDVGSLLSYRGIAEGVENSNFLLHTTKGQFILTLYEKRVSRGDLPFFLHLMRHLAAKNIACPQAVARRDGQLLSDLAGRPAALITFLEGIWMRQPAHTHCAALGTVLAQMHLAAQDFSYKRANSLSIGDWRILWQKIGDDANRIAPEREPSLASEIAHELDFLEKYWPHDLPQGVIHADLFPDNVFFIDDRLCGLIDFYFACNDMLAYDLAICLNAWGFDADFSYNRAHAQALISAYHAVRPLDPEELAQLPLLARGAALRFFLTRSYDWFHTPTTGLVVKKDPLEYVAKLRFFRQIDDVGQINDVAKIIDVDRHASGLMP